MAHVLVVEDDEATRALIETVLRRHKLDCLSFGDGAEALDALSRTRFDAVVLDLVLPRVSGFDVLRMMAPEMLGRVVVCTALSLPQLKGRDELQHIHELLLKPIGIMAMARTVLAVIAQDGQPSTRASSRFWLA